MFSNPSSCGETCAGRYYADLDEIHTRRIMRSGKLIDPTWRMLNSKIMRRMWFDCGASSNHRLNIEVNGKFFHWAKEAKHEATTLITSDQFRLYTGVNTSFWTKWRNNQTSQYFFLNEVKKVVPNSLLALTCNVSLYLALNFLVEKSINEGSASSTPLLFKIKISNA